MRIFSPNQISEALFAVDPFKTACTSKECTDAYGDASRGAYARQLEGFTIKEALVLELVEWFFEYERLHTSCLDPVVEYLQRDEGS